jgi:hypothetical protein
MNVPAGFEFEFNKIFENAVADKYLVEVTVSNIHKKRTLGMNDKFHAMCGDLAREASDGSKAAKNHIKEVAKTLAVEFFGYPQLKDTNGDPVFTMEGKPVGMSTADATPAQMTLLMDALRMLADQYDYNLDGGNNG